MSQPVFTRGMARTGLVLGVGAHLLLLVSGCLIPFTAGVSVISMLPCLIGWPAAALLGWRGTKALDKSDPARQWAIGALISGGAGLALLCATLGMLLLSILTGVAIAELDPGFGRAHH